MKKIYNFCKICLIMPHGIISHCTIAWKYKISISTINESCILNILVFFCKNIQEKHTRKRIIQETCEGCVKREKG